MWSDKAKHCHRPCIWMPAGGMKRAIHHTAPVTTGSSQLLQPDLLSLVKIPVSERDENSSHHYAHEHPLEIFYVYILSLI